MVQGTGLRDGRFRRLCVGAGGWRTVPAQHHCQCAYQRHTHGVQVDGDNGSVQEGFLDEV
eukprot:2509291-Rhodomonas_salina.1